MPESRHDCNGTRTPKQGRRLRKTASEYAAHCAALRKLIAASNAAAPNRLPQELSLAFGELRNEIERHAPEKTPAEEFGARFNPEAVYEGLHARNCGNLPQATANLTWIETMLGYLSYWHMKDAALAVGENGAHQLLISMQEATKGRDVRFHLMGHSFGCIVMSGAVRGPDPRIATAHPIDSLCLVQGALSLWSYCQDIDAGVDGITPSRRINPGHFYAIVDRHLVKGPIITTQSVYDSAVCTLYPLATRRGPATACASREESLPRYGAVGQFGLHGPSIDNADLTVKHPDESYQFRIGGIYNIDCTSVICKGDGILAPTVTFVIRKSRTPFGKQQWLG